MESVATKNITKTRNAHWRDYLELTKPRVVALLLLTAVVGMCLATEELVSMNVLVPALAGIGLMSAAAAAINHLVDRHIDAKMARTLRRPLPQGN
ncbi:UbiA family prenyltransferase, partial [Idiomarina sp.]